MGKERRYRGMMIAIFFVLYFSGRFGIEYFKEIQVEGVERTSATFGLSMGQLLSTPCILLGVYGIFRSLKNKEPVGWVSDDEMDEDEFDDEGNDGDEPAEEDETEGADDAKAPKKLFDKDVADEFSLSAEERRELTRKEAQKDD
jgi:hypothetical protein